MPYDKQTQKEYMSRRYSLQRLYFIELMGRRCSKCSNTDRLEFDHKDASAKSFEVGRLFTKNNIIEAVTEIVTKCQLLCYACHREKTALEQRGDFSFKHGSQYGWMKKKCQCEKCLEAKWKFHDARNLKRRTGKPYKTKRGPLAEQAHAASLKDEVSRFESGEAHQN